MIECTLLLVDGDCTTVQTGVRYRTPVLFKMVENLTSKAFQHWHSH